MKTTHLGFYSTSGDVSSDFAAISQSFEQSWYIKDLASGTIEVLTAHISEKAQPDDLIFFGSNATGTQLIAELNALADVCGPDSQVYVFSPERDVFVYREILGMGVAGCEGLPINPDFITQQISNFLNFEGSGKLVLGATVLAGVGFSTAFINLASRCAYRIGESRSVSLVDGDSTAGISNLFISQSPKSFVQFDSSPKTDFFQGSVVCDSSKNGNFRVFPTPARLLDDRGLSSSFLEEGLSEVTNKSDYTFVDFGLFGDLWRCQAVEYCDYILLASRPTLNGVRVMREVIQNVIETRGPIEKISCIFIGQGRGGKNEISLKKIKEILPNIKIFGVPDFASYVFANESSGTLKFQRKRPSNKYEKSIDQICSSIMG
jgi:pilus assembly protein CpaE